MSIQEKIDKEIQFKKDLASVINKHSRERFSNTPDFILAEYIYQCLSAYERTIKMNFDWHKKE